MVDKQVVNLRGGKTLLDLPNEILDIRVFPHLPIKDILSLGQVNKRLNAVTESTNFWRFILARDHAQAPPFLLDPTTQGISAKAIYRGLYTPVAFPIKTEHLRDRSATGTKERVYTRRTSPFAPLPRVEAKELHLPRGFARKIRNIFVEIYDCDGKTMARTAAGDMYILKTKYTPAVHAVARPTFVSRRLRYPFKVVQAALGPTVLTLLNEYNRAWFGFEDQESEAYHHTSPLLQCPSTSRTHGSLNYVTDLTIGTNYAHFLTSSREVVYTSLEDDDMVFAPRLQVYHGEEEEDAENFTWGNIGSQDCGHFVSIPTRPLPIADTKVDGSMAQDGLGPGTDARVCKIVEWDDAFLALRTNGDVWFFETVYRPGSPHWIYLTEVSSPEVTMIATARIRNATLPRRTTQAIFGISGSPRGPIRSAAYAETGGGESIEHGITMDLQDRIVVDFCGDNENVYALMSSGKLYMWQHTSSSANTHCSLEQSASRLVHGDGSLFVYSISCLSYSGLGILAFEWQGAVECDADTVNGKAGHRGVQGADHGELK